MSEPESASSRIEEATDNPPETTEPDTENSSLSDDEKLASLTELTGNDPIRKPPKLSFRAAKQIAPLDTATEFFEGYKAVTYIFDEDDNTLWIVPLNEYDEGDGSTMKLGSSPGDGFNARVLYGRLNLNYEKTRRFDCEWVDEHEAVKVDMDQTPEKIG